jgi:hypothetical protein
LRFCDVIVSLDIVVVLSRTILNFYRVSKSRRRIRIHARASGGTDTGATLSFVVRSDSVRSRLQWSTWALLHFLNTAALAHSHPIKDGWRMVTCRARPNDTQGPGLRRPRRALDRPSRITCSSGRWCRASWPTRRLSRAPAITVGGSIARTICSMSRCQTPIVMCPRPWARRRGRSSAVAQHPGCPSFPQAVQLAWSRLLSPSAVHAKARQGRLLPRAPAAPG